MLPRLTIIHYTLIISLALLPFTAKALDTDELSNPVYIAALLLDEPADRDMAKLCEYYGFTEQTAPTEDPASTLSPSDKVVDEHGYRAYGTRANLLRPSQEIREEYSATPGSERIFTRSDGAELRFRATGDRNNTDPVVEVRFPQDTRETHKNLEELRFEQQGKRSNLYRKGTKLGNRYSVATLTGDRTRSVVRFTKVRKR